jgi:hypothetical protein
MDDTMHDPLRAKAKVLRDLHTIVISRLFGNDPWLVNAETARRISHKLCEMGLDEVISDEWQDKTRNRIWERAAP